MHNTRKPARSGGKSSRSTKRGPVSSRSRSGSRTSSRFNDRRRSGGRDFRRPDSRGRGGNRSRRGGRFAPKKNEFHISQFINKATPQEQEVAYDPTHTFNDFAISPVLAKTITYRGYTHPTPIQDQIIPSIIEGRDVVGLANTGTGKTAAFLIPLIDKVFENKDEKVLVLAPTRELAIQIEEELRQFSKRMRIFSTTCVGGMPIGPQIRRLGKINHFVIGTPGRVMDLMDRGILDMQEFHTVVLDEADRMLDMGFIGDMRKIMAQMPVERQTLFFSATMSPDIEKLIHDFLTDPIQVSVKTRDTSKNIDQDIVNVRGQDKVQMLHGLLVQPDFEKVIVFGETKYGVERLARDLGRKGVRAESIHGNKSHNQRQRSLKNFTQGRANVLVATDVAARGLDIDDVTHVINYDLPQTYDDYVHRIGRTGRGSKTGKALTFVQ